METGHSAANTAPALKVNRRFHQRKQMLQRAANESYVLGYTDGLLAARAHCPLCRFVAFAARTWQRVRRRGG
jgi:hypothetical protein